MYLRINAFALTGRTNDNTQGVASLALGYALIGLSARLHVGTHGEKTHCYPGSSRSTVAHGQQPKRHMDC